MFNQKSAVNLSATLGLLGLTSLNCVTHSLGEELTNQAAKELIKFLKEIPDIAEKSPNSIPNDFGSALAKAGVAFGRLAPMGQVPKLVGQDLGVLGKKNPVLVKQGMKSLMKLVRGGDVWEETDNEAAQRARFDTLDIILAALNAVSADDKMPDWVSPELARTVTEMIVLPFFMDRPMIKALAVSMEGAYGLLPSEIAEKTSAKACETLEVLLALSPDLTIEAKRTADNIEGLIDCEDFRSEETHPIAVCALGCARSSISKAGLLSSTAARNRLRENVRQLSCITLLI